MDVYSCGVVFRMYVVCAVCGCMYVCVVFVYMRQCPGVYCDVCSGYKLVVVVFSYVYVCVCVFFFFVCVIIIIIIISITVCFFACGVVVCMLFTVLCLYVCPRCCRCNAC